MERRGIFPKKSYRERDERPLLDYYACHQLGPSSCDAHHIVWETYALKQRTRYIALHDNNRFEYNLNFTPCYICSSPVEKETHFREEYAVSTVEHNWNISHLVAGSITRCHEIFNVRIICRSCNSDSNVETPASFAKKMGWDCETSLAVKENITTLARGLKMYFALYYREGINSRIDSIIQ